jgi:alpha-N-arabinofuranosidase
MTFIKALLVTSLISLGTSIGTMAQIATINIDATRVENHVSPRMYASFVEMMAEDVKRGLTAEMLRDRSFEEAPDYLGLPAHWQLEPDERNDNVGAIKFAPTTEEAYPQTNEATGLPEHALRITLAPGDITDTRRGLSQGHLSVRAGEAYKGYLWANVPAKTGYTGSIIISLEEDNTDGETYAYALLSPVKGEGWHQYSFSLTPSKTDRFAKLSILFGGKGELYLDQISLEPGNTVGQVRPDSEAMIRGLHPSFMRWPGGNVAQDYHWRWGIGPRDKRPVWVNKSWSNAPEPDDFGTDEYLALCSRLHIEPSITVNVDGAGATPEEAASWVEYVNGPVASKYGAMRAANGHPAPYALNSGSWGTRSSAIGYEAT